MPPTIVLIVIAFLVTIVLAHGYRTLTALLVLRSLPSGDTDTPSSIVDGEPVTLSGELTVEEPVETAAAAVEDADRPVGAYLWRSRFSDNSNSDLTIEDWGWERQHWHTFASGIEWGRFGVDAGNQTVRIDPSWLRTALDAERLEKLEIGGVSKHDRLSVYLWDSWYTYLRNRIERRSFRRFSGYVQRHNDEIDLDRYLLEARPMLEGDEVSISGEIHVEQGEPVLRGTDNRPLVSYPRLKSWAFSREGVSAHTSSAVEGPASSYRPRFGRGLSGPPSTVCVDCPADLIAGGRPKLRGRPTTGPAYSRPVQVTACASPALPRQTFP